MAVLSYCKGYTSKCWSLKTIFLTQSCVPVVIDFRVKDLVTLSGLTISSNADTQTATLL